MQLADDSAEKGPLKYLSAVAEPRKLPRPTTSQRCNIAFSGAADPAASSSNSPQNSHDWIVTAHRAYIIEMPSK